MSVEPAESLLLQDAQSEAIAQQQSQEPEQKPGTVVAVVELGERRACGAQTNRQDPGFSNQRFSQ